MGLDEETLRNGYNKIWKYKWIVAGAFFALICLLSSWTTVDFGSRSVVLRLGKVTGRVLDPGLHFLIPFIESSHKLNVQTQIVMADEQASSRDLQVVHTQLTLGYYTDPNEVTYVLQQLNNDARQRVIIPAMQEAMKSVTARYDAEKLISERPAVRDGIESFLNTRLTPHHIRIDSVSITNFSFSKEFNDSIEAKVTASQKAMKAKNDLDRIRTEAEQTVAAAEGQARALKAQREAVTPELIQLRTVELLRDKRDGHFPDVMVTGGGALPLLDVVNMKNK